MRASDADFDVDVDDFVDDIFINKALEVNMSYTTIEEYTGEQRSASLLARFRVMCQDDYYGADCNTFCAAQNDNINGHYTCSQDGAIQCLQGFQNTQNNCRDSKWLMVARCTRYSWRFVISYKW